VDTSYHIFCTKKRKKGKKGTIIKEAGSNGSKSSPGTEILGPDKEPAEEEVPPVGYIFSHTKSPSFHKWVPQASWPATQPILVELQPNQFIQLCQPKTSPREYGLYT